jgi:homoaconitate hydratase family protein
MSALTATEKMLADASDNETVEPGDIVEVDVDLVMTMDYLGQVLYDHLAEMGADAVFDEDRVVITFDHVAPANTEEFADMHEAIRESVKEYGGTLYDIGEQGIMHQLVVEEGFVTPGTIAVGTDSHVPTAGAVGAIAMGMGATDAATAMATGNLWVRIPENVKVTVKGEFEDGVTARDMMFHLLGEKGWDGEEGQWAYKAVEFGGPTIENMSIDSRLTTTNLVSDMGATSGFIEADDKMLDYMEDRARFDSEVYTSDEDASYVEKNHVDVSDLDPVVACPHSPDNVEPVTAVEGTAVDQAVIGSCTGGRIEDMRQAAAILEDHEVHEDVRLLVSPASTRLYKEALREGLLDVFMDSGGNVMNSSCGPCIGMVGTLGAGETCITNTPRNMKGRMGSSESFVYSGNPMTVAARAIEGEITDPRTYV